MDSKEAEKIIDFLHQSEKLKTVLRHSWLSSGRRESVAEHSWRMALMAMLMHSYLDKEVNLLKVLKMILVHDLVEINYQDNPAFKKQPKDKEIQERKSLIKLVKSLPSKLRLELMDLWEEYETGKTQEARFAKAMDKTEVLLQHNEADIKFLTKKEVPYNFIHGLEHCEYDSFLKNFRQLINQDTRRYYYKNKVDKKLYKEYL
jgi:putative hydrolase of HD superfamily